MEMPENFPPGFVLGRVAEQLNQDHSDLRIGLSTNLVTYGEALTASLNCVGDIPGHVQLPTTNPVRRAHLRKMALENIGSLNSPTASTSSRVIRTQGKLDMEDFPRPLSPNRRALLKKKFQNENFPPYRDPYILTLLTLRTEEKLAAIVGNVTVSAVDWDTGMSTWKLPEMEILWDIGAQHTIITTDVLGEDFSAHLSDPVHDLYRRGDGTRVLVSF
ncbi:hypothetical protein ACN38_g9184 [Penicillium nordicum]|uniref:Peptidase A2 domain-containing protein n=1 Tax=Penicillium nordicum TaxID=229535 RepID=A0A0N0RY49_9EURO|nr:hypothetical protein ACN38_g9184 [Penicillium nordicum]